MMKLLEHNGSTKRLVFDSDDQKLVLYIFQPTEAPETSYVVALAVSDDYLPKNLTAVLGLSSESLRGIKDRFFDDWAVLMENVSKQYGDKARPDLALEFYRTVARKQTYMNQVPWILRAVTQASIYGIERKVGFTLIRFVEELIQKSRVLNFPIVSPSSHIDSSEYYH